ncbi:ABC transporter permease [Metabacillus fastidiosus]|uniref:ABC transporter permease n=1 Tax=Metabacillus fastidiosus TaxID=1458 RepID=UPI002E1EF8D6|nr:ABC transporter permease [Metabacillus fastidiosus]
MGGLIINEWVKVFSRIGTLVMISLIILFVMGFAGLEKYLVSVSTEKSNTEWKQEMEMELAITRSDLEKFGEVNSNLRTAYEREIAIKEYRLEHDLPPSTEMNMWSFVDKAQMIISFAGLFIIIIAAGTVASEFSWGTIKLLLIRPISRSKILLSKYITILLYGIFFLSIIFVLSAIMGFFFFGTPTEHIAHLAYVNGEVVERNIVFHLIGQYLLSSIDILLVATMAFMISAVFRNGSLAIGLSLFLMFTGGAVTMLLAGKFAWIKYFLFANTNLNVYFDGVPPVEGMTLEFSITVLIIYLAVFHFLAFWLFNKRDVAA